MQTSINVVTYFTVIIFFIYQRCLTSSSCYFFFVVTLLIVLLYWHFGTSRKKCIFLRFILFPIVNHAYQSTSQPTYLIFSYLVLIAVILYIRLLYCKEQQILMRPDDNWQVNKFLFHSHILSRLIFFQNVWRLNYM